MKLLIQSQTSTMQPWSLGMDTLFHPKLYWECDYLSIIGLKLIHVSKWGPRNGQPLCILLVNFALRNKKFCHHCIEHLMKTTCWHRLCPIIYEHCNIIANNTSSMLMPCIINSSPPCAAYMHQWIGSALLQKMACRLFGAKPLSKPMLDYCQLGPKEQTSVKFYSKYQTFHSRKCIWKYRLRNGGRFVQRGWV